MVDCPDVEIPIIVDKSTTTTTSIPPTGRPGDTGATGAMVGLCFFIACTNYCVIGTELYKVNC